MQNIHATVVCAQFQGCASSNMHSALGRCMQPSTFASRLTCCSRRLHRQSDGSHRPGYRGFPKQCCHFPICSIVSFRFVSFSFIGYDLYGEYIFVWGKSLNWWRALVWRLALCCPRQPSTISVFGCECMCCAIERHVSYIQIHIYTWKMDDSFSPAGRPSMAPVFVQRNESSF